MKKDVVTCTTLISAYGMYGEGKKALISTGEMEAADIILPDHFAFGLVEGSLKSLSKNSLFYNLWC